MLTRGTIADVDSVELLSWEPEVVLPQLTADQVRYSCGFLRAKPERWFEALPSHWLPLFHAVGVDAHVSSLAVGFDFPEDLERVTPVEVDGEIAVIGMSAEAEHAIAQTLVPGCDGVAFDVVLEYVERRLVSTFTRTWSGQNSLNCYYLQPDTTQSAEVVGVVELELEIGESLCSVWFGVGPRVRERLDLWWRRHIVELADGGTTPASEDTSLHTVSFQLSELAVPPALLIDYMRSGTIINLGLPATPSVVLSLDGKPWGMGKLHQFDGRFAAEVLSLDPMVNGSSDATTKVAIELAQVQLDHTGVIEHSQVGAVLLSGAAVSANASMVVSGESVASGVVGEIDGQFAINVLSK